MDQPQPTFQVVQQAHRVKVMPAARLQQAAAQAAVVAAVPVPLVVLAPEARVVSDFHHQFQAYQHFILAAVVDIQPVAQ
jgi:hypothetical protein